MNMLLHIVVYDINDILPMVSASVLCRRELSGEIPQCYLRMSASSQEGGDEYSSEASEIDTLGTVSTIKYMYID